MSSLPADMRYEKTRSTWRNLPLPADPHCGGPIAAGCLPRFTRIRHCGLRASATTRQKVKRERYGAPPPRYFPKAIEGEACSSARVAGKYAPSSRRRGCVTALWWVQALMAPPWTAQKGLNWRLQTPMLEDKRHSFRSAVRGIRLFLPEWVEGGNSLPPVSRLALPILRNLGTLIFWSPRRGLADYTELFDNSFAGS